MGKVDLINVETVFTYQPPTAIEVFKYSQVREVSLLLARVILEQCPDCADRTDALRKLREVRMTANAAIALGGLI